MPTEFMHDPPQATKGTLEKAIKNFDEACQNWAFKGAHDPSQFDWDDAWYAAAKLRLRLLTGAANPTPANIKKLYTLELQVEEGSD